MPKTETAKPMPRLLVLSSTYPRWRNDPEPGFVHALSHRLTQSFEVHVICPHAAGALPEEFLDGVRVHRFRYAPRALETLVQDGGIVNNLKHHPWKWLLVPAFFLGLAVATLRAYRNIKPTCIHAHWIIPQGLMLSLISLLWKNPPPYLLTAHGGDLFALRGRVYAFLKRLALTRASAVTVVSQAMVAEAVRLGANKEHVHVLPMGVDFEGLFTLGRQEDRQPGEILFVGRLVEKKGLRYLMEAMPIVLAKYSQARLIIAGFGPEEAMLLALVQQLGISEQVDFLGAVPQVQLPGLYRRASVFVAPFIEAGSGDKEGMPVALMEAVACGVPVVVGNLSVLDKLFQDCEVEPTHVAEMAERILQVLDPSTNAYQQASKIRDAVLDRLSWQTISKSYEQLLLKLTYGKP